MAHKKDTLAPCLFEKSISVVLIRRMVLEDATPREMLQKIDGQRAKFVSGNIFHSRWIGPIVSIPDRIKHQQHQRGRTLHHRREIDKVGLIDILAILLNS
jgi:hypothetical protein